MAVLDVLPVNETPVIAPLVAIETLAMNETMAAEMASTSVRIASRETWGSAAMESPFGVAGKRAVGPIGLSRVVESG
jgi:hypothetical protein